MIGTPFKSNDEKIQRKVDKINKKPWEQEVRDEQGRRRFHGAFTGGFSAGYFNTVGTKEGWVPSTFISGRNKDKTIKEQSVMDYMDEEDIKEQVGINNIVSKPEFKTQTIGNREKNIIAAELPKEIFTPVTSVISSKLLLESGYDEKPKKKYLENENKYYKGKLEFKDDYHGIGYTPGYDEIVKIKQDTGINKNRIKMNQFEDDVDMGFFNSKDISEYTFEENDEEYINHKRKQVDPTPKFMIDDSKLHMDVYSNFKMPKLPNEYDPFNKPSEVKQEEIQNFGKMNPEKRSIILGESNKFLESKFTKAEDRSKPPSSTDQISSYFNYTVEIPFKNDLAKVARFTKFIAEKEGLIVCENYYNNSHMITGEEIKKERQLFESIYQDEQKLKRAEMILTTNKKEEIAELTSRMTKREKIKWRPDKILCKRFKIKDPFENIKEESKFIKGETINDIQRQIIKEEIKLTNIIPGGIKTINNERNIELIVNAKQDINLFEEIFG